MYNTQLIKMAESIAERLAKKPLKTKKGIYNAVLRTLEDHWKNKIAVVWTTDDVKSVHDGLTDEQAKEVLDSVHKNQDAGEGVNWDTIRFAAEHLFGKAEKEEEDGDNELIAEYKDTPTETVKKLLADKELALIETEDHLTEVELKDEIDGLKRVLEIRENELPEKESDAETSLEFLGPTESDAKPPDVSST